MPSNKIFVTLIMCVAVVISIWLLFRTPVQIPGPQQNTNAVSIRSYISDSNNGGSDWKKILVSLATSSETVTNLTNNGSTYDDTTLTGQMSRDFMSQYLLLVKSGQTLTSDQMAQIANNVLSSPQYASSSGPIYVGANLHIIYNADPDTLGKYKSTVNLIMKNIAAQVQNNSDVTLNSIGGSSLASGLSKIGVFVTVGHKFINDLLNMEVPTKAIAVHLGFLNAISNVMSDMESMREINADPVRSIIGMSQYNKHLTDFQIALTNMNAYLGQQ
jgi:hypothetical protein